MAASPRPTWEVALGPRDRPRFIHVPDEDLSRFVRSLAARGVAEIQVSNGRQVFRINRLAPPPKREPAREPGQASEREPGRAPQREPGQLPPRAR